MKRVSKQEVIENLEGNITLLSQILDHIKGPCSNFPMDTIALICAVESLQEISEKISDNLTMGEMQ